MHLIRYYSSIFFILFFSQFTIAGNDNPPAGARSSAMGNATVSSSDAWSIQNNQAGLAFVKNISAGINYENKFLLKELSTKTAVIIFPIKGGTFGVSVNNFGYSLYNENKYSLTFAKSFGAKFSAGIAMDYLITKIAEGYGNKGVFTTELGLLSKPMKELSIGAHVYNPTHRKLADYNNERIPTIIRLGAHYDFSEKVTLAIETEKDISQKAIFRAGIEYKAVKEFYLRAGIATNPTLSSFGFGLNLKNFKIDFSANYHQVLGFSPQLSLTYVFKKNE